MRIRLPFRRPVVLAAPALAVLVVLGACGDDDDEATASSAAAATATPTTTGLADGDVDTFCAKLVEVSAATAGPPVEEGDVEAGKALAAAVLPIGRELAAAAPASVKADVEQMVAVTEEAAETGDTSGWETPEFGAADANVHAAGLDSCGWAVQNVELQDYHFMGLPDSLPVGVTSFEVTNAGKEMHEIAVLRKNDGVSETFDELLALPQEEALSKVTSVAVGFAPPGVPGYAVVDLTAGDYLAVCFLPVGLLPDGPPPEEYVPHFTQGMSHEFTVG